MVCHGYKGGIGTSSRVIDKKFGGYTVGVLVQANYGGRSQLTIAGIPMGEELKNAPQNIFNGVVYTQTDEMWRERGSIIVVVATDAPLLPHQLKRIAQRVPLGIARMGGIGGNGSGDIFFAFSTANQNAFNRNSETQVTLYPNDQINALLAATIQATEEAITNALFAGRTMVGINGNTILELPKESVIEILKKHNRFQAVVKP